MHSKISIIVPIYNVERFLDRCVESLINQTYDNLEIILVDDGSPDKCPQMCDQYSEVDPRIRVIHKINGGLSDARNAGLDIATGEYVIFVDPDDYVEKDLCETLEKAIHKDVDIYAYRFRRFFDSSKGEPYIGDGTVQYFFNDLFEMYINRNLFTHMVCDKMFKLELFNNVRFIKGRLAEDLALCYQLFGKAKGAAFIDKTFYNYYVRTNSIMGTGSLKLCLDTYKGECEAFSYSNKYFAQYSNANNVRFLNQSMKTYLKLRYRYNKDLEDDDISLVLGNVYNTSKIYMPLSTKIFYTIFRISKPLAWKVFQVMKLS